MLEYGTKRRSCFWMPTSRGVQITGLIFLCAIMAMFIILLAGGLQTTVVMNSMKKGMDDMNGQMMQGSRMVKNLAVKFPANQPELTARQLLGIIANVDKLTARSQYLLDHVEAEAIGETVKSVNKIIGAVSPDEIELVKTRALGIVSKVDNILAGVDPAKIAGLLDTIGKIDPKQLNALISMVSKLHEIKIQL